MIYNHKHTFNSSFGTLALFSSNHFSNTSNLFASDGPDEKNKIENLDKKIINFALVSKTEIKID